MRIDHQSAKMLHLALLGFSLINGLGCARSPEDGRVRGGGRGADGGNHPDLPIHAPSKLDGTRSLDPIR